MKRTLFSVGLAALLATYIAPAFAKTETKTVKADGYHFTVKVMDKKDFEKKKEAKAMPLSKDQSHHLALEVRKKEKGEKLFKGLMPHVTVKVPGKDPVTVMLMDMSAMAGHFDANVTLPKGKTVLLEIMLMAAPAKAGEPAEHSHGHGMHDDDMPAKNLATAKVMVKVP